MASVPRYAASRDDARSETSSIYGGTSNSVVETPNNVCLDEFKHQVRLYLELDNEIKRLGQTVKEKRGVQRVLADKILAFMDKYNIEDLNTKEGKLRYKVTMVKPTVKKADMKDKLMQYFQDNPDKGKEIVTAVFESASQPKVEKVCLRRLRGARVFNI